MAWPCGGKRPRSLRSWLNHLDADVHYRDARPSVTGDSCLVAGCDGERHIVARVHMCGGRVPPGAGVGVTGGAHDASYESWLSEMYPETKHG